MDKEPLQRAEPTRDNNKVPDPEPERVILPSEVGIQRNAPQLVPAVKKSFVVESVSEGPTPQPGTIPFTKEHVLLRSRRAPDKSKHLLFIKDAACGRIFQHIGWENPQAENSVEQGGWLLGEVIETDTGEFCGIVKRAIPAVNGRGSSAYLRLGHDAWKAMYDQLDANPKENGGRELLVVGWYHTHPNNLPVFMSGTDLNTQRTMFSKPWQFAVVLNPHQHVWAVFQGPEADECPGYIVKEDSSSDTPGELPQGRAGDASIQDTLARSPREDSRDGILNPWGTGLVLTILVGSLALVLLGFSIRTPSRDAEAQQKKKLAGLQEEIKAAREEAVAAKSEIAKLKDEASDLKEKVKTLQFASTAAAGEKGKGKTEPAKKSARDEKEKDPPVPPTATD